MVPVVGLLRCPGACPDWGAFFRGIFWGHIGGHVEQNSVCRDTNAVDERNQPHLVFWLYFITFLQYFPLFFRISLPPWGALLSPGREGGARIPGSTYPSGGRGCSGASGRSAPLPARPRAGARLSLEESRRKEHQGGRGSSSLDPPFLVGGTLRGSSLFSAWPAALYLTPVTARPPAGRAGGGGFADGKGRTAQSLPLGGKLSPKVTDEGATDMPNEAIEKPR